MTHITLSLNESSVITKSFEYPQAGGETTLQTATEPCKVFVFGDYLPADAVPDRHVSIDDLVATWEGDPVRRAAMEDARRWIADEFHSGEPVTMRTLRLRKGLSQQQLAEVIGTSQSHVARIEGGASGLNIDTCRRLARALEVDLNMLDQALQNQERFALSNHAP